MVKSKSYSGKEKKDFQLHFAASTYCQSEMIKNETVTHTKLFNSRVKLCLDTGNSLTIISKITFFIVTEFCFYIPLIF